MFSVVVELELVERKISDFYSTINTGVDVVNFHEAFSVYTSMARDEDFDTFIMERCCGAFKEFQYSTVSPLHCFLNNIPGHRW